MNKLDLVGKWMQKAIDDLTVAQHLYNDLCR